MTTKPAHWFDGLLSEPNIKLQLGRNPMCTLSLLLTLSIILTLRVILLIHFQRSWGIITHTLTYCRHTTIIIIAINIFLWNIKLYDSIINYYHPNDGNVKVVIKDRNSPIYLVCLLIVLILILIVIRLSGVGSRGEQLKQGAPDFLGIPRRFQASARYNLST